MEVRWAMITSEGKVVTGKGATRAHLTDMFKGSIAGAFQIGSLQLFVAGAVDLKWTVQLVMGCSSEERAWGILPRIGSRVWILPSGHIGIGESIEAVEGTIALVQAMDE